MRYTHPILTRKLPPKLILCLAALWPLTGSAGTPMANPSDATRSGKPSSGSSSSSPHLGTWELPAISVPGTPKKNLREEELIGPYKQPRWTAHRRFTSTRVYVRPEGMLEFEYWTRLDVPKEGPTKIQNIYELEFGLPHRIQLDLYFVSRIEGDNGPTHYDTKYEIRYALADWGVLPGNPTIYLEYALRDDAPDKIESKLLFGGELSEGWHWGSNLVYEGELSGDEKENEYSLRFGLSHTLEDEKLSVGMEAEGALADVATNRGDYKKSVYVGPSVQYLPLPNAHLDLVPMFGVTSDSKIAKILLNFGWEF